MARETAQRGAGDPQGAAAVVSNDPEIYLTVVQELGDPTAGYPHEHTIEIPGCERCGLGKR